MGQAGAATACGAGRGARPAEFRFELLGQRARVVCSDPTAAEIIRLNYAALIAGPGGGVVERAHTDGGAAELCYEISRDAAQRLSLRCPGQQPRPVADPGEMLFLLEKHLIVALQRRRPDLLFLHAAALEHGGRVYLLAGESGHGKSTTAWGLLHHGFQYLSDELAPLAPQAMQVHAYPHALCLKRPPPAPYAWPQHATVLDLGSTLHVPVAALPARVSQGPLPLAAVLLVHYQAGRDTPRLQPLGSAEAAARLYLATLNALAHPARGLDVVLQVAQAVPCFALQAGELAATCELVGALAARIGAGPTQRPAAS